MLYNICNRNNEILLNKGGILLNDTYYGKCIIPDSQLDIYVNNKYCKLCIKDLYEKYCKNLYDFDGLGYWFKLNENIYVKSFNIKKNKICRKKIIYLYKQNIQERIKIIKLENGSTIESTMQHKFFLKRDNKYVWDNLIYKNDYICYSETDDIFNFIKVQSLKFIDYNGSVYDLKIAKFKNYFSNNILCHNTSNNIFDLNKKYNYFVISSNERLNFWEKKLKKYKILNNLNEENTSNLLILYDNFLNLSNIKKLNLLSYILIFDYSSQKIDKKFHILLNLLNFKSQWFIINNYTKYYNKNNKLIKKLIQNNLNNYNNFSIIKNNNLIKLNKNIKYRLIKFNKLEKQNYDKYIEKFKNIYKENNIKFLEDEYLKKYCCFPNKCLYINLYNSRPKLQEVSNNYNNLFSKTLKDNIKNGICSICLNNFNINNIGITKCNHIFCYSCINKSINISNKCPKCRYNNDINDIYLYTDNYNIEDNINYNLFGELGSKFTYLFKMISNLENVIIFSNYDDNLIFIKKFLKKINVSSEIITNINNINNYDILLSNFNYDNKSMKKIKNIKKNMNIIFLSPYYHNNKNYSKLKYIDIISHLGNNILDIYFLLIKNSIEEEYIKKLNK